MAKQIDAAFGSFDEFKKQFSAAGATQFGSGWAWLVKKDDGAVAIAKTPNAETPLHTAGSTPLLTMDVRASAAGGLLRVRAAASAHCRCLRGAQVWEHAYYKDQGPGRASYIDIFVNVRPGPAGPELIWAVGRGPAC